MTYNKLNIWSKKVTVNAMVKLKPDGHTDVYSSIDVFAFSFVRTELFLPI